MFRVRRTAFRSGLTVAHNGRGYKIVAEYEATTYRTAQSHIRATTLQFCSATAMFYSLC